MEELYSEDTYKILETEYAKALGKKLTVRALSLKPPFVLKKSDIIKHALELIEELKMLITKL